MISKTIKSLAAYKIIKSAERHRNPFLGNPPESCVLILDKINLEELEILKTLSSELKIKKEDFFVVECTEKSSSATSDRVFKIGWNDINFKGDFKNPDLNKISSLGADLLITFAEENNRLVQLLSASVRAGIKLGNSKSEFLDVVIKTDDAAIFRNELIKFLKQLNCNDDKFDGNRSSISYSL
ncbi:MAG: hypothetical protein WCD31_02955 [Gillisia sp.]